MNARRALAAGLAALLLAAVGGGVWYSRTALVQDRQAQRAQQQAVTARGLIGSEKEAFFQDERVRDVLARHGVTVTVQRPARAAPSSYDPKQYDFGFPSGAPAAAQLKAAARAGTVYTPFYTPIVFASWRPIAEILIANGVAQKQGDFFYVTDLPALLAMAGKGTRWRDLKASGAFATGKAVLPASTDVQLNSAAMYLALASYVLNGQQVVQSPADLERVMPQVAPLFLRQGFQESSSAGPFEDYLALGMGKAPLLVAYESQLVEFLLRHPQRRSGEMVMLYPQPTLYSKHVLVPYTPAGDRVGQLLESDPQLRALAQEYGFAPAATRTGPSAGPGRACRRPRSWWR
jgi:hypothetical protein